MNRNTKLLLMFAPLVLLFTVLAIVVNDLRHPQVTREQCKITDVGMDVSGHGHRGRIIYHQSENPLHDVSLQCSQSGELLLNDLQLRQTPIKRGQEAELVRKHFHFLPERWMVSVHTGK